MNYSKDVTFFNVNCNILLQPQYVEKKDKYGYTNCMRIISLEIKNFRNHSDSIVNFNNGLNVLFGDNAEGKTNTIESIYFSSLLSSPRTKDVQELIKFGENKAVIKLVLEKAYRQHTIAIQIDDKKNKKVLINNIPVNRAGEVFGVLGIVYFSPDELKIVKESPQERRHFLDVGISQQQRSYFKALQTYTKILKQKNALLKEPLRPDNFDSMLDVWDQILAQEGAIIIKKRIEYIKVLNDAAAKLHARLSSNEEKLVLSYESDVQLKEDDIEKSLYNALIENRQKDKELKYSTAGPHRDDLKIEIDGKDSRKFASQGQQRSIALALKLGEIVIYKDEIGEYPVLLLDDVLSELDDERKTKLLEMTNSFQTILTCTKYDMSTPATLYHVEKGTIRKV